MRRLTLIVPSWSMASILDGDGENFTDFGDLLYGEKSKIGLIPTSS
jgi:hypothetical protein